MCHIVRSKGKPAFENAEGNPWMRCDVVPICRPTFAAAPILSCHRVPPPRFASTSPVSCPKRYIALRVFPIAASSLYQSGGLYRLGQTPSEPAPARANCTRFLSLRCPSSGFLKRSGAQQKRCASLRKWGRKQRVACHSVSRAWGI